MNFLIPQGIGDGAWALLKIQGIAKNEPINIFIACFDKNNTAECRSLEFVRRFKFVNSAEMYEMPRNGQQGCVLLPGPAADENGLYRYIPDGKTDLPEINFVLIPNATLERGIRIEDWLPEYKVNWRIMDYFYFKPTTFSEKNYVVFFLGSLTGNTVSGHNRNGIWKPDDWIKLGEFARELGCEVVVVGAEYDYSYYQVLKQDWIDLIGACDIGETFTIVKNARFVISYQSGIGIVASYMGVPTGIFWRAKGDSISPDSYISFEEKMTECWVDPEMKDKHLPLIYGRHDVNYIMDEIKKRNW